MMLRWLLILRNRKRPVSPSGFVISQVCASFPSQMFVTVTRTPSGIAAMRTSRPRTPLLRTWRTPPAVVSTTSASSRARRLNVSLPTVSGPSEKNQRKPSICVSRGKPSGMRNLTEPSPEPSYLSQLPSAQDWQDSHSSSGEERSSLPLSPQPWP